MQIELNGTLITTSATNLATLLNEQGLDAACVATALNGEFVPRSRYANTELTERAKVEVLSPMQGG